MSALGRFSAMSATGLLRRAAALPLPAALPAASSAAAAAAAAVPLQPVRLLHFPRTVRGVGPRPRVPSFLKQPWLRRRLAAQRARAWKQSHPTAPLDGTSQQLAAPAAEARTLPVLALESGAETSARVTLDDGVFGVPLRQDLVWEVVRWQRACRRQGTHKTKDRSEVYGSGKKMRPQKGSGRARVGDMHAPHHVGGGRPFPKRPSDYSYKLPAHTVAAGKRVALSAKAAEGNLYVVEASSLSSHSESTFAAAMHAQRWGSFLMVHLEGELDPNLALAARRNPNYQFLTDREFNVYDCVKAKRLVMTKGALEALHWRLQKANVQGGKSQERTLRFLVGSYGGGYTRAQVDFVRADAVPAGATPAADVDIDGLKLVVKENKPFATPIHWP